MVEAKSKPEPRLQPVACLAHLLTLPSVLHLACLVTPEEALAAQQGANGDFSTAALTLYRSVASCSASSASTCWVSSRVAYKKGYDCKKTRPSAGHILQWKGRLSACGPHEYFGYSFAAICWQMPSKGTWWVLVVQLWTVWWCQHSSWFCWLQRWILYGRVYLPVLLAVCWDPGKIATLVPLEQEGTIRDGQLHKFRPYSMDAPLWQVGLLVLLVPSLLAIPQALLLPPAASMCPEQYTKWEEILIWGWR